MFQDRFRVVFFILALLAVACSSKDEDSAATPDDIDGDADADADADADTDTDTDTDTDADPPQFNIGGLIDYDQTTDGETVCDATLGFSGTPYTGDCFGCDYAFVIESSITADNSTASCEYDYNWILVDPAYPTYAYYMLFFESYDYYGYTYNDVMLVAGYYDWTWITYDDAYYADYYGEADLDGNELSWSFSDAGEVAQVDPQYGDYCADEWLSAGDTGLSAADQFVGDGQLPCPPDDDSRLLDVWSFDVTEGDTVTVSVDTTSAETAADLAMWINNADTCIVGMGDEEISCTYPPPEWHCPATQFEAPETARYQVALYVYGSCAGDTVDYQVGIDAASEPSLIQDVDDAAMYSSIVPYTLQVEASATITPVE